MKDVSFQLSQIDFVVKNEIEKQKEAVDAERKAYIADEGEEFRKHFDKMNDLKLAFLQSIIDYKNKHSEFEREYYKTFRSIEKRVGLRGIDPRDQHELHAFQRYQIQGRYSPMLLPDEIREAFVEGKLTSETEKNKNAFKRN